MIFCSTFYFFWNGSTYTRRRGNTCIPDTGCTLPSPDRSVPWWGDRSSMRVDHRMTTQNRISAPRIGDYRFPSAPRPPDFGRRPARCGWYPLRYSSGSGGSFALRKSLRSVGDFSISAAVPHRFSIGCVSASGGRRGGRRRGCVPYGVSWTFRMRWGFAFAVERGCARVPAGRARSRSTPPRGPWNRTKRLPTTSPFFSNRLWAQAQGVRWSEVLGTTIVTRVVGTSSNVSWLTKALPNPSLGIASFSKEKKRELSKKIALSFFI